jgi:hypothetical protein
MNVHERPVYISTLILIYIYNKKRLDIIVYETPHYVSELFNSIT